MKLRKNESTDGVVDEAASGSRKGLLVVGVAAGLAVVVGMGYVLVSGGGDDAADTGVVASANHAPAAPATAAPTKAAKAAPAIKKYKGKAARDPFKPLVVEPVSSSEGGTTGSTSGTSTGSTGGSSTAPTTNPTTAPSNTSDDQDVAPPGAAVTLKLVSVTSTNTSANFQVDSKAINGVKKNQEFGEHFKLLALTGGRCADVQFGDISVNMCEGKTLTVG